MNSANKVADIFGAAGLGNILFCFDETDRTCLYYDQLLVHWGS